MKTQRKYLAELRAQTPGQGTSVTARVQNLLSGYAAAYVTGAGHGRRAV
jgi:hypothetical protein